MYWVINGCCDLVQLFRWMIAQSHSNCKVSHESQSWNIGIWEFPLQGWGLYRILIPETGAIIRLRNVKFKEELGHHTLTPEGEYFKDNNNNLDLRFLNNTTVTPAKETTPPSLTPNLTPNPMPMQPTSWPRIVYPPASQKPTWNTVPSRGANESEEYKLWEENTVNNGDSWVTNNLIPVIGDDDDEDDTHMH